MDAKELINKLEELIERHGKVDVLTFSGILVAFDRYGEEIKVINIEE